MKRLIISLCFIISMVMFGGIVAQNNNIKTEKLTENSLLPKDSDSNVDEWENSIEPLVGVWSLVRTIDDTDGKKKDICPGTFMVIHADASYTIFVYTDAGAIITSQGVIIVDSPNVFIEVISQHVNNSLVGISNRIEYKLDFNYLHKSFWIEKDKYGDDYEREVKETWKRARIPAAGEYEDNPAFPI